VQSFQTPNFKKNYSSSTSLTLKAILVAHSKLRYHFYPNLSKESKIIPVRLIDPRLFSPGQPSLEDLALKLVSLVFIRRGLWVWKTESALVG
jgi:hypothetical protein